MWRFFLACTPDPDTDAAPVAVPDTGDSNAESLPPVDTGTPPERDVTDSFEQLPASPIDMLFVVDNSCSMSNEQRTLVENFPVFVSWFLGSGLDYHIGVVSTDIDTNQNGSRGRLREVDGARWIDDTTVDPIAVFGQMALMGTSGSSVEKGIGATWQALELHRDDFNQGFLRDDSGIHVVVVSDEPDLTPPNVITGPDFVAWFEALRTDSADRTFSSIVGPNGDRYVQATQQLGGALHPIANDNYALLLEQLGLQAASVQTEFVLSRTPEPDTLDVTVTRADGTVLSFVRDEDWVYVPERNSVSFLVFVPETGSTILVRYVPAD